MNEIRCPGCMRVTPYLSHCSHCGYDLQSQNASHQLPVGTMLQNQYQVGRILGQGGFGITYLGWDQVRNIPIAIKEYYPAGMVMREHTHSLFVVDCTAQEDTRFQSNLSRFLREAQALARLQEIPQVVHVYDFFSANGTAYIIMEYINGITLKEYLVCSGGTLGPEETFSLLRPIMNALDAVHAVELVHRDISPDNIMILPEGGAKLLDFGAVREVADADVDKGLANSTEAILKHGFAPMEQYQRRGTLGPWTDIYALCATIYYCLTGQTPPDAPARMIEDVHPDWFAIPQLSTEAAAAMEKGMSMLAKDRFLSVKDLLEALFSEAMEMEHTILPDRRKGFAFVPESERIQTAAIPTANSQLPDPTPIVIPEEETIYEEDWEDETVRRLPEDNEDETVRISSRSPALLVQPAQQKAFLLTKPVTTLGRSSGKCDIVIRGNDSISKLHAELCLQGAGCTLTDCHSANGTYVHGEVLIPYQPVTLESPAVFQLNDETLVFLSGIQAAKALVHGRISLLMNESGSAVCPMEEDTLLLNRSNKWPDGTLSDSKIHRAAHARLSRINGEIYLVDESPAGGNGTHLNGSRLQPGEQRLLTSGDHIRLGRTILTFLSISI